jgi:uncharacterized membrane protein
VSSRHALLIATDHYDAPDLSQLRSPSHDVERLDSVLADPRIGAFQVRRVVNRPAHEVKAVIEDFLADRSPDDVLLLYFSCHGVKDDVGRLHFAATNTQVNRLASSAIEADFVAEQVRLSISRKIILLLDCCYSGAFARGMLSRSDGNVEIQERLGGSGRAIIYSSTALEYAFELDIRTSQVSTTSVGPADQPSIFTNAVIEGLSTGDADHDGDGAITVDDLYEYVHTKVAETTPKQTPGRFMDVRGELVIAHSPQRSKPPVLPEEVVSAVEHPLPRVREAAVDTLKRLALLGGESGQLAYERLLQLFDDDSRAVASHAREAIDDIARQQGQRRPSNAGYARPTLADYFQYPASEQPQPKIRGYLPPENLPHARWPNQNSPQFGSIATTEPETRNQERPDLDERIQGGSSSYIAAYLLPFFTSLALAFHKKKSVRFHAFQSTLSDAFSIALFIAESILIAIYSSIRYGSNPVPQDDPILNIFVATIILIPLSLRTFCIVQLMRHKHPRLWLIGRISKRFAYRKATSQ